MIWNSAATKRNKEWLESSILFQLCREHLREEVSRETLKPSNSIVNSSFIVCRLKILLNLLRTVSRTSMVVRRISRMLEKRQNISLPSSFFVLFLVAVAAAIFVFVSPASWMPLTNLWTVGFRFILLLIAFVGGSWFLLGSDEKKNYNCDEESENSIVASSEKRHA